jgi:hypothetical protein
MVVATFAVEVVELEVMLTLVDGGGWWMMCMVGGSNIGCRRW